jgi:hypothetical protein
MDRRNKWSQVKNIALKAEVVQLNLKPDRYIEQ